MCMYIHAYIHTHISISLSLSLSLYIYKKMYSQARHPVLAGAQVQTDGLGRN